MSEYPLVHALLTELCGLDEMDLQLPLAILLNLYQVRLRAPLLAVAELYALSPESWVDTLKQRYPNADAEELFGRGGKVELRSSLIDYYNLQETLGTGKYADPQMGGLIRLADQKWMTYFPAVVLYRMGTDKMLRTDLLPLLQLMLDVHPAVGEMLVDLGGMYEAALSTTG